MTDQEIKTTPEIKNLAKEYSEGCPYLRKTPAEWHKIDADKSNYINFHMYCEIQDWLGIAFARRLQESNDSIYNHDLSTMILQGPEYEYTTGSRFTKWLKKKLLGSKPPEILRIVFDDYHTDVDMTAAEYYYPQLYKVLSVHVLRLISKSKEYLKNNKEIKHD